MKEEKTEEKIEHKLKIVEKRDKMLRKDYSANTAVFEEVFDRSTLMVIYNFLNKGIIDEIHGTISAGKEARVYWAKKSDGKELAVKIYLTYTSEFKKGMLKYIVGDRRFKNVKHDTRSLIFTWAQKEYRNLEQATSAKVRVPKPVAIKKNVLIMEFIGENGNSAPIMKYGAGKNPTKTYNEIIKNLKILYTKAKLVHGDLSEYNIMIWNDQPIIFDLSQAVPISHHLSQELLLRDINNLNRFFSKLDVKILGMKDILKKVMDND